MYAKRFWLALLLGVVTGVICALMGYSQTPESIRTMWLVTVVLNRTFIGFVIGISGWLRSWVLHGILIGLIGTLPMSVPLIINPETGINVFLMYTAGGIIWGFVIELFTSVVFKARMKKAILPESAQRAPGE